eukprot:m.97388 g.97388  ORF g.97388 m.97388 type:complete len:68 (+) comp36939_c0_seq16:1693-1896(+)
MGIQPLMYVTQWFLSLFTCLPCWKAVLSVWDCFMIDGVTTVFQAALAILQLSSGIQSIDIRLRKYWR